MKKILKPAAAVMFTLFMFGIVGLVASLTWGALAMLFPGDLFNQLVGLVLFDAAALVWALAFAFRSESMMQYVFAAFGFIAGLIGTIGMIGMEVGIKSGMLEVDAMRPYMVYAFVGVATAHLLLLYAHHASAPEIDEAIRIGIARGEIVGHAITEAEKGLETQKAQLAQAITADIMARVARDLALASHSPSSGQVLNLPALPVDYTLNATANGWPLPREEATPAPSFFDRLKLRLPRWNITPQPVHFETKAEHLATPSPQPEPITPATDPKQSTPPAPSNPAEG